MPIKKSKNKEIWDPVLKPNIARCCQHHMSPHRCCIPHSFLLIWVNVLGLSSFHDDHNCETYYCVKNTLHELWVFAIQLPLISELLSLLGQPDRSFCNGILQLLSAIGSKLYYILCSFFYLD